MSRDRNTLSLGQLVNFHTAVLKALPRDIDPEIARYWEINGEDLHDVLRRTLLRGKRTQDTTHLKFEKHVTLRPMKDNLTIQSLGMFSERRSDFDRLDAELTGAQLPRTRVGIYEVEKTDNFSALLDSLYIPLEQLCLRQSQVAEFWKQYSNEFLEYDFVYFPMLSNEKEVQIASRYMDRLDVDKLSDVGTIGPQASMRTVYIVVNKG